MLEKIREILAAQLNLDPEDVVESASFKDDLGVDSLDLLELVMSLEDEYGFEISAEQMMELGTVGDVLNYLRDCGISD